MDLGNNCFQFRFEREDDLQRVLDNRPYHFGYWMVILQRWEPIISPTFPSQIPFWIRIRGLPLHYRHEKILYSVGRELGTYESQELTRSTARVRVLVDGLKPLIKETIMEFDSGEESLLTLDYERLENHYSICGRLSHLAESCPVAPHPIEAIPHPEEAQMLQAQQRPRETAHRQRERSMSPREARTTTIREERNIPFQSRVDRHGNTYGDRAATRQTRNPPPVERITGTEVVSRAAAADWRADHTTREREALSPPYVKQRESRGIRRAPLRTSVSHHQVQQWRAKPQLTFEQAPPDSGPSGEQENHSNKGSSTTGTPGNHRTISKRSGPKKGLLELNGSFKEKLKEM